MLLYIVITVYPGELSGHLSKNISAPAPTLRASDRTGDIDNVVKLLCTTADTILLVHLFVIFICIIYI